MSFAQHDTAMLRAATAYSEDGRQEDAEQFMNYHTALAPEFMELWAEVRKAERKLWGRKGCEGILRALATLDKAVTEIYDAHPLKDS